MTDIEAQFANHYNYAYGIVRRYIQDDDSVPDLVQTSMLKAWQHHDKAQNFRPWFARIVANTCIDAIRAKGRQPLINELTPSDWVADGELDARTEAAELLDMLQRVLLPDEWRALNMWAEGYEWTEVAAAIGRPVGATKAMVFRGRQRAREWARGWQRNG